MKIRMISTLLLFCCLGICAGCNNTEGNTETSGSPSAPLQTLPVSLEPTSEISDMPFPDISEETIVQNDLGALSPEEALAYMQKTENLVIVDVAAKRWYEQEHFEGAINIPIEELNSEEKDVLYMEIPADRPVILHCRQGVIVPGAYRHLKELRSEIPEISYISGAPPFGEYNEWLANQ